MPLQVVVDHPMANPYLDQLIPEDAHLVDVLPADMGDPLHAVVAIWERVVGKDASDEELADHGLVIWRLRQIRNGRSVWRAAFAIHERSFRLRPVRGCRGFGCYTPDPESEFAYVYARRVTYLVGPPGRTRREVVAGQDARGFVSVRVMDLTGDGREEVFTVQGGWGSGGVAIYRVLGLERARIRQVFRRIHGDGYIKPKGGDLLMRASVYEPDDSHCCPTYFRFSTLEWNGQAFVETESRVVPVPY